MLELIVVIAILGIVATMAAARMDFSTLSNMGSRVAARQMAMDLAQARRRAIATGDNHLLAMQASDGAYTGYTIERRAGGSTTAVDTACEFPTGVTATLNPNSSPEFDFQGEALSAYTITIAGPNRSWQINVYQLTGAVRVTGL